MMDASEPPRGDVPRRLRVASEDARSKTAARTALKTAEWVKKYAADLKRAEYIKIEELLRGEEFKSLFDPLNEACVNGAYADGVLWCAVGMKVALDFDQLLEVEQDNHGFIFFQKLSPPGGNSGAQDRTESRMREFVAKSIGLISRHCHEPPFNMFLATSVVVNFLESDDPLLVTRQSEDAKLLAGQKVFVTV